MAARFCSQAALRAARTFMKSAQAVVNRAVLPTGQKVAKFNQATPLTANRLCLCRTKPDLTALPFTAITLAQVKSAKSRAAAMPQVRRSAMTAAKLPI